MSEKEYDLIIIGGGAAGYTAGIYAGRDKLNTVLLEKGVSGGTAGQTDSIDNYPGFPEGISGAELMNRFKEQGEKFGLEIKEMVKVKEINPNDNGFKVQTNKGDFYSDAVIVSTGGRPNKLGLESEKRLSGRGISYCATCDGPFFQDEEVAVVGGGDAAVQEAIYLTKFAKKVYIIHRRDELRAVPALAEKAFENDQIEVLWDSVVDDFEGEQELENVKVKDVKSGQVSDLEVPGVFIYIGWVPNTDFVEELLELDDRGRIITNKHLETSVDGIYAAGDVRSKRHRQVTLATGEGTRAALNISGQLSE